MGLLFVSWIKKNKRSNPLNKVKAEKVDFKLIYFLWSNLEKQASLYMTQMLP